MIYLTLCFLVLSMAFGTQQVRADGDGPDRPLTPAEKSYFSKILGAIDRALPQVPANWVTIEKPLTSLRRPFPKNPRKARSEPIIRASGLTSPRRNDRRRRFREYAMKSPPRERDIEAMQKQMDVLQKKQQAVMDELVKASQKNDKVGLQKAQEKLQALQKKSQQASSALFAPQEQVLKDFPISDACLRVEITVNHTSVGLKKAVPLSLPGVPKAFKVDDGNPGMKDCPYGKVVILLELGRRAGWGRIHVFPL